jgi:signal transduction histidine kinase
MTKLQRLPVRWRLALTSAGLTFAILALFGIVIGVFTARQVRSNFDDDLKLTAVDLAERIHPRATLVSTVDLDATELRQVVTAAAAGDASVRIVDLEGEVIAPAGAQPLGPPRGGVHDYRGYRVVTRVLTDSFGRPVAVLQYGKPLAHISHTLARIRLFLVFGVFGGTVLALLAGLAIARRAMTPIAQLTHTAQTIARTRDTSVKIPRPAADDEVAELARTLDEMLAALDSARAETQEALDRQRRFVADASHELRTPLTSILANLELLSAELEGEDADAARSALRSSRRMRRLVADLLLLARADAGRVRRREPIDLRTVVSEAAGEVAPLAEDHELSVDLGNEPLVVEGTGDELHRLALNLIQNSLVHTPSGTEVRVSARRDDGEAVLEVSDDGPGIPAEMRAQVFDRFVRAEGDGSRTGGSGLGLAIVSAVAESHRGSVELSDSPSGGARFVVRLPLDREPPPPPPPPAADRVTPQQPQAAPSGGA